MSLLASLTTIHVADLIRRYVQTTGVEFFAIPYYQCV